MATTDTLERGGIALDDPRLRRDFSYIGGRWTGGTKGASFAVTDPADGTTIGHVAGGSRSCATTARISPV